MNIRLGDLGAKILGKMVAGYVTDPGDRTTILDFIRRSEIIREQLGSICPDMIHRGRLAFVPKNCGAGYAVGDRFIALIENFRGDCMFQDRKSTRLNSSKSCASHMQYSA